MSDKKVLDNKAQEEFHYAEIDHSEIEFVQVRLVSRGVDHDDRGDDIFRKFKFSFIYFVNIS
jgi:hypothetical protein